jgi:hypothetical protein
MGNQFSNLGQTQFHATGQQPVSENEVLKTSSMTPFEGLTQAEVLFYPDVFQMYDDKMNENETTRDQTQLHHGIANENTHEMVAKEEGKEKPENKNENVKVLQGIYRDGDDYMIDVLTENDRELMRIFPAITEPEHSQILFEIYGRRKHLDEMSERVNKIATLYHELIEQERLGMCKDQTIIAEKKEQIAREE